MSQRRLLFEYWNVSNVSSHIVLLSLFDIVKSLRENAFESFSPVPYRASRFLESLYERVN